MQRENSTFLREAQPSSHRRDISPEAGMRRLTYYRASDLAANPQLMSPPDPIAPPLFYRGRTVLLAGREKVGKSTLIGALVAAVTTGGEFLGETATAGDVLYYSLDEARPDTVQRLQHLRADLTRILLCFEAPSATELAAALSETRAALVVIDTINELVAHRDLKDASVIMPVLRPVVQVIREAQACGIMLGHASKGRGEFLGAVQIGGVVDAPLTLRRYVSRHTLATVQHDDDETPPDDGRRILEGKTRWAGAAKLTLSFDGTCYARCSSPPSLRDQILQAIRRGGMTRSELLRHVRFRAEDVRRELEGLISAGIVVDAVRGEPLRLSAG